MRISVSFLSENYDKKSILKEINMTDADYIHIDVMDGKFVSNFNMPIEEAKSLDKYYNKKLDVHLMVNDLEKYIKEFIELKPEYITFHIESSNDILKYIKQVKNSGIKCGLSLKPNTDIEKVFDYLSFIDLILVMSVEPGKSGQKFIPEVLNKIKMLKKQMINSNNNCLISIDGGINEKTYLECLKAGVDILVIGSYLHDGNMAKKIEQIKKAVI